jgi:hypothetical protein
MNDMDIDKALAGLRTAPTDTRLEEIDSDVIAGIAVAQARRTIGPRPIAFAAIGALLIGVIGTFEPEAPASASPALTPLAYAPSTLLVGR